MKRKRSDDGWKWMSGEAMNADMNTAKTHILPHLLQKLDPYLSHWLVWSQETGVSRIWRVDGMCSLWQNEWGRFQRGPEWGPKRPGINTDILNILFRDLMFNGCFKSIIALLKWQAKVSEELVHTQSAFCHFNTELWQSGTSMEPVLRFRIMGDLRWMLIGSETWSAWSGSSWERSSRLPWLGFLSSF